MSSLRRRALARGAAALSVAWAVARCAAHPVDAVIFAGDGGAPSAGGDAAAAQSEGPPPATMVWPNPASSTNSDPWIAQHHNQILEMEPKVLVLDFANTFQPATGAVVPAGYDLQQTVVPLFNEHANAFAVASTYHGYKDPGAQAFLQYQLKKIVDLRDSSGAVNSAKMPVYSGSVDYAQLNTQAFADEIGIADPNNPGQNLTLCSLFEKGVINEVWAMAADPLLSTDPPTVKFDEVVETKQAYDATDEPMAGRLMCTSSPCVDQAIPCSVTVRIYDFNPGRGAGCHLFVNGLVWQNYLGSGVLPAFANVARTFFNFDFDQRFHAPFPSFESTCQAPPPDGGACIHWLSETHAASGPASANPFDFSPMTAGCGNVFFPPNATGVSVQQGDVTVLTSCENYGLHNGDGGADLTTPYTKAIAESDYTSVYGVATDCGGSQPTYLFASMPGLRTPATASDGTPMKNWWVYLFY
jgi:hypothetical protein